MESTWPIFDEADFNMSDPLGHPDEVVLPEESGPTRGYAGPSGTDEATRKEQYNNTLKATTTENGNSTCRSYETISRTRDLVPGPTNTNARSSIQQHQPVQQPQQQQPDRPHPNIAATREQPTNQSNHQSSSPSLPSQHFAPAGVATNEPPRVLLSQGCRSQPSSRATLQSSRRISLDQKDTRH